MTINKILKFIIIIFFLSSVAIAEEKKDCSAIKVDTGVKLYEKWKCKQGSDPAGNIGDKLKKLFKKIFSLRPN